MKNILKAIAFIACLMLPLSAMAMSAISDSDLSTMTGQSGVSINMNVDMNLSVATLAWGDADGVTASNGVNNIGGTAHNTGWVGLTALNANGIQVQLRTDLITAAAVLQNATVGYIGVGGTGYNPNVVGNMATGGYNLAQLTTDAGAGGLLGAEATAVLAAINAGDLYAASYIKPLTIDVATDTTTGHGAIGTTFVRIGLGSLEIQMASMTANVKLSHTSDLSNTINAQSYPATLLNLQYNGLGYDGLALDNTLGQIYLGGLEVDINGASYVDIYARSLTQQGVVLGLNVKIDKLNIDTLAWGDSDGIGTGTTAGWVGLTGLKITNLTVTGNVGIDVAQGGGSIGNGGGPDQTYILLGLTNVAVGIGGLNANVALGGTTGTMTQVLGSLYLSNMTATVNGSIQIAAPVGGSGVMIAFNNLSIGVTPFTVSWGDSAQGIDNPGYVGLTSFAIGGLKLNGFVTIDVATVDAAVLSTTMTNAEVMYAGYASHNMSNSFVHIGLGTGTGTIDTVTAANNLVVGIDTLTANVVLAADKTLVNGAGTLGMISATGIKATMNGWVDIAAH